MADEIQTQDVEQTPAPVVEDVVEDTSAPVVEDIVEDAPIEDTPAPVVEDAPAPVVEDVVEDIVETLDAMVAEEAEAESEEIERMFAQIAPEIGFREGRHQIYSTPPVETVNSGE
jgi:hypothetical protein